LCYLLNQNSLNTGNQHIVFEHVEFDWDQEKCLLNLGLHLAAELKIQISVYMHKGQDKVVPICAMKVYRGSECTVSLILHLISRWRWVHLFPS